MTIAITTWVWSSHKTLSSVHTNNYQDTISIPTKKCATREPSDPNTSSVGSSQTPSRLTPHLTQPTDPESHEWDPLDGELTQKLDQRRYVSLSRDRRLAAEGIPESTDPVSDNLNDEEVSLFDLHMPGVLTVEEVEALDLDHWLLLVHGSFVHMNVSVFFSCICVI